MLCAVGETALWHVVWLRLACAFPFRNPEKKVRKIRNSKRREAEREAQALFFLAIR